MSKLDRDTDRIERALEGLLAPAELEALHAEIVRNPALRARYVERAWLHGALWAGRDRLPEAFAEVAAFAPQTETRRARPWLWIASAMLATAACVTLALTAYGPWRVQPAPMVATITHSQNTRWAGSTLPTAEQSRLGPGTLSLVQGMATLTFESGAVVTLEAPTKLEIVSAMRARLLEGSVTADVPEAAHGFTIDTPDLKVVDLGTRFGVTTGAAGDSHVFVFEGEVRLDQPVGADGKEAATAEPSRHLLGGESFHVRSGAATGNLEPRRFAPVDLVDGWTSIPTSYGRGKDAYVRRGYTDGNGSQPLLMVKHSSLETSHRNERRAFLAFDLGELASTGTTITEAELILDSQPSGLGFSAMVEDAVFAVYGVTDEALDGWEEDAVMWVNSPGVDEQGPLAGQTVRLGEFEIPRGGIGGPMRIRGTALAEFLRQDTNGLVTFVVVRETGETHSSGLVHAFASKEHPAARPPTLRIR